MNPDKIKVLFVCLGNICRSPLAEGAFQTRVEAANLGDVFEVDSAGTGHWHAGEAPDKRGIAMARSQGVDISHQRARQLQRSDLVRFHHILAMDQANLGAILSMAGPRTAKVGLLLDEIPGETRDVPDPYYGANDQFELVWQLVDDAAEAFLSRLRTEDLGH